MQVVLQATVCDCRVLDPFAFEEDGLSASEVDVSRGKIVEALVIAGMVVMRHEGGKRPAMLSSPRSPSSTMRIFSSAEKCRRVARRMSLIASSAGCLSGLDFCLIFAPCGYDDPEILPR